MLHHNQHRRQPLDADLVAEFVRSAHKDLVRVQELLQQEPGLLLAKVNWGGSDWESALGAASHVGRRDIALFLLEQGAPLDLFAAAMLGELPIVQSMIERYPYLIEARGPHDIALIDHARIGGEEARSVVVYLEQKIHSYQT